jgi:predicted N-acyltransferase
MLYVPRVFNSVNEIERAQWEYVCSACGSPSFMDLRFVAAVEAALKPRCRFWYVILYEDGVRPVACAGLTAMKIDLTDFGDPRVRQILKHGPRFLSRFGNMSVLFCSLPGSPGDRSIAILPSAESAEILAVLDRLMVRFATDAGLDAIIFKEFAPTELECMDSLSDLGYRRIEIPPMHLLDPSFGDFSQYCGALRKKYRQSIGRSTRKLATTGIVSRVLTDPTEILEKYTPEIHEMYCEVVRRSDLKIEILPIEYYQQLVLHMHGQIELVALIKDSQILAFGWCLCDGTVYHMMYGGFDYQLNSEYDLYFNMVYACFDRAFQKRVKWIHVGQTATDFKARMGCYSEARYVYAKGLGLLMSALFRWGSNLLVIKMPARSPARIFKGREQRAPRSVGMDRRRRESDAA